MASRKSKKQRRREKLAIFEDFERSHRTKAIPQGVEVIVEASGQMSEVLLDFIEPYTRHVHSEDEFRNAIRLGLVAWNTALLPKERQVETIERFIDEVVHDGADDFRQVVYEMIERKQRWFAQIKRLILKYHLTVTENGPHLSVISTLA